MFRFTIRDVLWLTVVVAMGVAWWIDRRQLTEYHRRVEELQAEALVNSFDDVEAGKKLWQEKLNAELNKTRPNQ